YLRAPPQREICADRSHQEKDLAAGAAKQRRRICRQESSRARSLRQRNRSVEDRGDQAAVVFSPDAKVFDSPELNWMSEILMRSKPHRILLVALAAAAGCYPCLLSGQDWDMTAVLDSMRELPGGLGALPPLPAPAGNPQTPQKTALGKALFF